jgi:hypothetical protein
MRKPTRSTLSLWLLLPAVLLAIGDAVVAVLDASVRRDPSTNHVAVVVAVVLEPAVLLGFAAVGWLLSTRRPGNPIGWILATVAASFSLVLFTQRLGWHYEHAVDHGVTPTVQWLDWVANWAWVPAIMAAFIYLPLLFPTGRLPSPRWRPFARIGFVLAAVVLVGEALTPGHLESPATVVSPVHPPHWLGSLAAGAGALFLPLTALGLAAVGSLLIRFRRSGDREHEQIKWVLSAAVLLILGFVADGANDNLGWPVLLLGMLSVVVSIAVAVLRYRLYDIDRVVSRTLAYALLTAVVVAVYIGVVTAASAVAPASSGVGAAAATLAAAAVFEPARRRLQTAVDHRFNRRRYDAARLVDRFAATVRYNVDPYGVERRLLDVTADAVQPVTLSVWRVG